MSTPTSTSRGARGAEILEGTRGPDDDFYCLKYQVWYRVVDCVYRGTHRTFAGCVNCFQGFLNIRSLEQGVAPPPIQPQPSPPAALGAADAAPPGPGRLLAFVPPARPALPGAGGPAAGGLRTDDGQDA